jgi:hypothetical protein
MRTRTITDAGRRGEIVSRGRGRRRILMSLLTALALLSAACGDDSGSATSATGIDTAPDDLSGHEWSINAVDDGAGIVLRGVGESPTETLVEGQVSPGNPSYEWDVDTGLPLPVVRIDAVLTEFADDQQRICDELNEWRRTLAKPPSDDQDDAAPLGRAHYVSRAAFSSHATYLARDSGCALADVGSFDIAATDGHDEAAAPVIWPSPIGREWACSEGSRGRSAEEPADEPGPESAELVIRTGGFRGIGDPDTISIEQAEDGTWIVVNADGEVTNKFWISPHPAGGFMMDKREFC